MAIRFPKLRWPSWRQAFLALLSFTVASIAIWGYLFSSWRSDDRAFVEEWFGLWERCRTSIETREPLETHALFPAVIVREPGHPQRWVENERILAPMEPGRFAIVESEMLDGGVVLRRCDVVFRDWSRPVTNHEQGLLMLAFMDQRTRLFANETHETRDPFPVRPTIVAGLGPVALNPANCEVIAAVFANEESATFHTLIGERNRPGAGPCGGASLLRTAPPAPATQS